MSSPLDMRTMNNGGVVEAVNIALAKVADNIADVNTPPDKPRTVTLKITFKPDESRTLIASKAVVTTNLQPQEPQIIPGRARQAGRRAHAFRVLHRQPPRPVPF